jgi:DNA-binding PadR family transcriptional regulator
MGTVVVLVLAIAMIPCLAIAIAWVMDWLGGTDASKLKLLRFLSDHSDEEFGGADLMDLTGIPSGRLYAILIPCERDGLVSSRWEVLPAGVARPRRRLYQITQHGEAAVYFRTASPQRSEPAMDNQRIEEIARSRASKLAANLWHAHDFEVDTRWLTAEVRAALREALSAQEEEFRRLRDIIQCDGLDPDMPIPPGLHERAERAEEELQSLRVERDAHCEAHAEAERMLTRKWTEAEARAESAEAQTADMQRSVEYANAQWRVMSEAVYARIAERDAAEAELLRLREGLAALDHYQTEELQGELVRVADLNALLAISAEEKVT